MKAWGTAPWFALFFVLFELAARAVASPRGLVALRVSNAATAYARRAEVARTAADASVIVTGDSTAERALDACALAAELGARGANLAYPAGSPEGARALLDHRAAPPARVVYMVQQHAGRIYTPGLSLRGDAEILGLAPAILGRITALYGERAVLFAAAQSPFHPEMFAEEIAPADTCGLSMSRVPRYIPADPAAQVAFYDKGWQLRTSVATVERTEPGMGEMLASLRRGGAALTIALAPERRDFTASIDRLYPGAHDKLAAAWRRVADRAGASLLDCTAALPDETDFYDPVHVNQAGRARLSTCLGRQLAGGLPCCVERAPAPPR